MITILLIDHAIENARSVRELLSGPRINDFKLDRMSSFREILKGLRSNAHDVCLIDSGFRNGLKLFAQAQTMPVKFLKQPESELRIAWCGKISVPLALNARSVPWSNKRGERVCMLSVNAGIWRSWIMPRQ